VTTSLSSVLTKLDTTHISRVKPNRGRDSNNLQGKYVTTTSRLLGETTRRGLRWHCSSWDPTYHTLSRECGLACPRYVLTFKQFSVCLHICVCVHLYVCLCMHICVCRGRGDPK